MTRAIARQIIDWSESASIQIVEIGDERLGLRIISPGPVLDYLLAQCGPRILAISDRIGLGILPQALELELLRARALLGLDASERPRRRKPDSDPRISFGDGFEPPTVPEPTAPPEIPDDQIPWPVCDATAIRDILKRQSQKPERVRMLSALLPNATRSLPKTTMEHIRAVQALGQRFPNFMPLIRAVSRELHLQRRTGGAPYVAPQLLLGPPGIGKTEFGRQLAQALGCGFEFQSLAEISGGFLINGLGSQWGGTTPGLMAEALARLPPGQPLVVMFDELDKVHDDSSHPPDRVLLGLLAQNTAAHFLDECLGIRLDLSRVIFLFSANRLQGVRPELLSRMSVVQISAPTPEQMPAVVKSVDAGLRARRPALEQIFRPLGDDVVACLLRHTPREIGQQLTEAYGSACEEAGEATDLLEITPRHLRAADCSSGPRKPAAALTGIDPPLLVLAQPRAVH